MAWKTPHTSKTRPSNTTTYSVGDVVAEGTQTAWTFTDVGFGPDVISFITSATLFISTDETLAFTGDLLLFDAVPTTSADNAANTVTDAQYQANFLGSIAFNTAVKGITGASYVTNMQLQINPASSTQTIYGILLASNAYVPASASIFTIQLRGIQARG